MIQIGLAVFGIAALVKGDLKISTRRRVRGVAGRICGTILLAGAAAPFFFSSGTVLMFVALLVAIGVGLATTEPVVN